MSHVFISYSRKDRETVDKIVARLNSDGVTVWLDRESIRAGDFWRESIVKAVDHAYACVLMLSTNSTASDNVRKEVDLADGTNKELIPVLLSPVELPARLRYQLAGIQWIEYYRDPDTKYAELLEVLNARKPEQIANEAQPLRDVEIVMEGMDISKLGPEAQQKLLQTIAEVINLPPTDLKLTAVRTDRGRTIVNMPTDAAYRLKVAALNRDERLIKYGIEALRLTGDRHFVFLKTARIAPLKSGRAVGCWLVGGLALLMTLFLCVQIPIVGSRLPNPFVPPFFVTVPMMNSNTPILISLSTPTTTETVISAPSQTPTPLDTSTHTLTVTATSTSTDTPTDVPSITPIPPTETPSMTPIPTTEVPARNIVEMDIASNDYSYVWFTDDTASTGTTWDFDQYRTPYLYTLPIGKLASDIVGIGIACSNDHVYAWYSDGTVSSGNSADLDAYRELYSYSLPPGKSSADIVGVSIASNDYSYMWFRDGTVSSGSTWDLDQYRTLYTYTLPPGKLPADIVGIGIACSNDHVYAWYSDGTVSSGNSADLDAYREPYSYALP